MHDTPHSASGNVQRFKSGGKKVLTMVVLCIIIAIALATWSHAQGILSWNGVVRGVGLMTLFCSGLSLVMGIQRVEIDSDKGTIRFANAQTTQRWREVGLRDVTSIRWVEGGIGKGYTNCLLLEVAPSAGRKPNVVAFNNPSDSFPPKAPPLFLALVDAVRTANPIVKVDLSGGFGRSQKPKTSPRGP